MPLEVSKFPEVPGATVCNGDVPLPSKTALAVSVDTPVPPSATVRSVMPVIVPPLMVGAVKVLLVSVEVEVRSASTNAVVANWIVAVPTAAVGASGTPVRVGEAKSALVEIAVSRLLNSVSNSAPRSHCKNVP